MGVLQTLARWYELNYGGGKRMLDHGAELRPCPHCDSETPVYQSAYDSTGMPNSFSVCRWCDGVIEYSDESTDPHEPYATVRDVESEERYSKP